MRSDHPQLQDEEAARKHIEAVRWPDGPVCVHCGSVERIYPIKSRPEKKIRPGLYKCGNKGCGKQFSATVGSVFHRSKVPLTKWLVAIHLMCSSKKGISAFQLHRSLRVQYKTAWFMARRIREAMIDGGGVMGGSGPVDVDETFWGQEKGKRKKQGGHHKHKILTLVERGGKVSSFHVPSLRAATLRSTIKQKIQEGSTVYTD
jgi:transposase-like protein